MDAFYCFSDSGLRDPEDRAIDEQDLIQVREKMLDKTIADSFSCKRSALNRPCSSHGRLRALTVGICRSKERHPTLIVCVRHSVVRESS